MNSPWVLSFADSQYSDAVHHRHTRGMIVVDKRAVGAQRLFQIRQREAGIDGQRRRARR